MFFFLLPSLLFQLFSLVFILSLFTVKWSACVRLPFPWFLTLLARGKSYSVRCLLVLDPLRQKISSDASESAACSFITVLLTVLAFTSKDLLLGV